MEKFIFKIQLQNVKSPTVYRRIEVPSNITFMDLGCAILFSMGWSGGHLWQFSTSPYAKPYICLPSDDDFFRDTNDLNARKVAINSVFKKAGDKRVFTYDFGDDWNHNVTLEKIVDSEDSRFLIIKAQGQCPPEDCGGAYGYEDFKKQINDPKAPEYKSLRQWIGLRKGELWDPAKTEFQAGDEIDFQWLKETYDDMYPDDDDLDNDPDDDFEDKLSNDLYKPSLKLEKPKKAKFEDISPEDILETPFKMIGKDWMLIAAKDGKKCNAMTASWGGMGVMWNKNVVFAVIRETRYTKELVDKANEFSLNFLPSEFKDQLKYFGTVSGRDEDKIKKSGLKVKTENGVPYFDDSNDVIIAKKLYAAPLSEQGFLDKTILQKFYKNDSMHTLYIAEIVKVLSKNPA